jgi:hypothetical protein
MLRPIPKLLDNLLPIDYYWKGFPKDYLEAAGRVSRL